MARGSLLGRLLDKLLQPATKPPAPSSSESCEIPDTGAVTATEDGGWVLNPESTFPLTIYCADREAVERLKTLLDAGYSLGLDDVVESIVPLMCRSNVRCKEVEDYTNEFRPQWLQRITELKQQSQEWATASQKDKDNLAAGVHLRAEESLDVRPFCGVCDLFQYDPCDLTIVGSLISEFGYDNVRFYLRHARNAEKVREILPAHRDRQRFENLVTSHLARRGPDIPTSAVLEALSLKDMNAVAADLGQQATKTKAKAIELLRQVPGVEKRLADLGLLPDLFQLRVPIEVSPHTDLDRLEKAWDSIHRTAFLIAHTYSAGGYAARSWRQQEADSSIKSRELMLTEDEMTCPYCKRAASKVYTRGQPPTVPLHIGCRCTTLVKFEWED